MFRRRRQQQRGGVSRFARDRVIVHTRDRLSFRGVLVHDDAEGVVLEHVERLDAVAGRTSLEAAALSLGGMLAIPAVNVSHVQRLMPPSDSPMIAPSDAPPLNVTGVDVVRPVEIVRASEAAS